ncbi:hypothetical protein [Streptomyces sp. AK02-01A]|uniref:hypothetical protein n=1 Tax=Streptomyces sp. AK02-01A TaxID=3028648 RepID=UPI0029A4C6E3|nr:hypothetical protein [Streptomyces sp. AK02-01A]MDX3855897.1 hypothetical protein [Streptomyces sp. AK02-01A]
MLARLQRTGHTAGLLAYLYGPGEHGHHINTRLITGDCHDTPIEVPAQGDALPYLARALDAPVKRLGTRAPDRPVWVCSVRADPRHPDLTDPQWAEVAHRMVVTTGIAPDGDPDACRWIALRNQPHRVYVVATLAREDGSLHNTYREASRIHAECQRIATELGHLPPAPHPTARIQEFHVPAPSITISIEPSGSGSVTAKGASDDLSAALLTHAGFRQIEDWYGRRHRLPTTTTEADRASIASHAAEMLRAARYDVGLDPALDADRLTTPTDPSGAYVAGAQVLRLTDDIRGAANAAEAARAIDQLLDPADGVLVRLQEALEAAGEQVTDLDDDAWELSDRLTVASEQLATVGEELAGTAAEIRILDSPPQRESSDRSRTAAHSGVPVAGAARATSPASANVPPSLGPSVPASITPASPAQGSTPRTR